MSYSNSSSPNNSTYRILECLDPPVYMSDRRDRVSPITISANSNGDLNFEVSKCGIVPVNVKPILGDIPYA